MTRDERFAIGAIITAILVITCGYGLMYICCKIIILITG